MTHLDSQDFGKEHSLAPDMTAEEFLQRKRKLKYRWWATYIFWMLVIVAVFEYMGCLGGFYVEVQPKRLDELQMMSGTFMVSKKLARISSYSPALKDEITGQILWINPALCGYDKGKEWQKYEGRPAKMWYFHYSGEVNSLYQLEVGGKLVSDLATANSNVSEWNERTRIFKSWIRFGTSLGFAVLIGIPCYGMYLQAKEKMRKEDDE